MRQITSSDLADLLNNGFNGSVELEGSVYCRIRGDKKDLSFDNVDEPTFYRFHGRFSLSAAGKDHGVKEGSYAFMPNGGGTFYFTPNRNKKIESVNQERYGDVIAFDIDFPVKGVLQIEPNRESIKF